jgi:hypothetical protein
MTAEVHEARKSGERLRECYDLDMLATSLSRTTLWLWKQEFRGVQCGPTANCISCISKGFLLCCSAKPYNICDSLTSFTPGTCDKKSSRATPAHLLTGWRVLLDILHLRCPSTSAARSHERRASGQPFCADMQMLQRYICLLKKYYIMHHAESMTL